MARIIMYSSYLKPYASKHKSSYIKYMGTRPGVQKMPKKWENQPATKPQVNLIKKMLIDFGEDIKDSFEYVDFINNKTMANASALIDTVIDRTLSTEDKKENYIDYIANRPRVQKLTSHGLFSNYDDVNIDKIADEVATLKNNMHIAIFSLRREDAAKLGYDDARAWRTMLSSQIPTIAHSYKIPLTDFRWYAALHDEGHHPHVHFVCWSDNKDGFLTEKGIENIKSSLAHQIFAQDFEELYEKKDMARNDIKFESQHILNDIINEIGAGTYENKKIEELLLNLSSRIASLTGKIQYGYLPKECKNIVDKIFSEISKHEKLNQLYEVWCEQKDAIFKTYKKKIPERTDLCNNEDFKSIKNIIVKEAQNLLKNGFAQTKDFIEDNLYSLSVQELLDNEPQAQIIENDFYSSLVQDLCDDEPTAQIIENDFYSSLVQDLYDDEPTAQIDDDKLYFPNNPQAQNKAYAEYTKEYQKARIYLYGNKKIEQNFEKAHTLLKTEAGKGNALAQYDIGNMYNRGLGVDLDRDEAQKWFEKAITGFLSVKDTKEIAFIEYRVGKMYSQGLGTEQDYEKAIQYYKLSSEKNSSLGQYGLGSAFFRGQGVKQDYVMAIKQYKLSATNKKNPNSFAKYELGRIYEKGIGTEPDAVQSYSWYKEALSAFEKSLQQKNDDMLQYRVGQMYLYGKGCDVNLNKAFIYMNKAAEIKNPDALYGLGQLYLNKNFLKYNPQKAVEYLNFSIKLNNQFAKYLLGKTYLVGEDVQKNVTEGLKLLESAAEDGNSQAEYLLGKTYLIGELTPINVPRAILMLERSVSQDNIMAQYLLGKTLIEGKVIHKDISRATTLLTQASDSNYSPAKVTLALAYLKGDALPKNVELAMELFKQAAADGNDFAQKMLERPDRTPMLKSAVFNLLFHTSKIISSDIEHKSHIGAVDRKELIKIMRKKADEGIRYD